MTFTVVPPFWTSTLIRVVVVKGLSVQITFKNHVVDGRVVNQCSKGSNGTSNGYLNSYSGYTQSNPAAYAAAAYSANYNSHNYPSQQVLKDRNVYSYVLDWLFY